MKHEGSLCEELSVFRKKYIQSNMLIVILFRTEIETNAGERLEIWFADAVVQLMVATLESPDAYHVSET